MRKSIDIKLSISNQQSTTKLKERVLQEELNKIINESSIKENEINIEVNYCLEKDSKLEIGCFIINTFSQKASLELVKLGLEDEKGDIILTQNINLKELGLIDSNSAVPTTISFEIPKNFNSNKKYSVRFLTDRENKSIQTMPTILDNIPLDMSFEEERDIRDFFYKLSPVKVNEVSLTLYDAVITSDKGVEIRVLFRNGYNQEIEIERLPITIENFNGISICKHVFQDANSIVKVGPAKAKLVKFKIDKSKIYNTVFDLDRCKILFQ